MYFKKLKLLSALFAVVSASALAGCVKQRKDRVSDSYQYTQRIQSEAPLLNSAWTLNRALDDGQDSFLKETDYTITAGNVLFRSQNSVAEQLNVESDSGLKFLDVVRFKSTHPLLDGKSDVAYMLGEPNMVYPVVEELTPTHLVLYKVVDEAGLSFNEQTFALRYNGKWRVPVGGYSVKYLRQSKVKNEDNRDTNIITYLPVPSQEFRQATHFEVDRSDFVAFDRFVKSDVLPKSFFEGEWYFTETTVDARFDGSGAVGDLGSSDSNFSSATKIKFNIYEDQIVGLNTNVDEEFKDDENSLNYNTVIRIKVEHRDFKWVRLGGEILKEQEELVKDKEAKRFVKLFYLESETPKSTLDAIFQSLFSQINNFKAVLDVTYGKDYFSYSIRDAQSGTIKRYSMRKVKPELQIAPRQAFKDDNRIFGSFTTVKHKKIDYKVALNEDVERLIIMARHNPNKDIIYHFTDRTPKEDWYRNIGRSAIDLWNQAFIKAGLRIRISLDESKDVALGDIRYNVLNIVKRAGAGLLGFGPSLIDSDTGEIVSASMNTGVDNIIEQYYRVVRNYLGRKSGRYYDFKKDNQDTELPSIVNLIAKINARQFYFDGRQNAVVLGGETHLNPAVFTDKEKEFLRTFDIAPNESIATFAQKITELRVHSYKYAQLGGPFNASLFNEVDPSFTSTMVLDSVIERNCQEVVTLADTMSNSYVSTMDEIQIIEPCVKMLAQGEAVLTTVHELGHNLSLRHNFRGSVDAANYPKTDDYQVRFVQLAQGVERPMTSSIMEYVSQEGQQVMPGLYDLAAIRWIYNEEVETTDGSMVKIDTTKRIVDNLGSLNRLKSFQFCTDEQRILVTDPMCNSFDQGVTVKDTVRFQVEQIYNALSATYRYDKRSAGSPAGSLVVHGLSMKAKYDQWRGFLRKFTGTNKSYLQGYSVQSYNQLIQSILQGGGQDAQTLREHLEVRNMIVRFLVDVAFLNNKYCVVVDNVGEEKLIELEKIRKELFGVQDYSVISSCQSPSAASYIQAQGYTFVREFGHFLDAGQFNQDPSRSLLEPLDFTGTASVRTIAMQLLTARISPSVSNWIEGFAPSMLDEPDIRNYIQFLILDRLLNGVRVADDDSKSQYYVPKSDLFGSAEIQKHQLRKAYVNFNNEGSLIQQFTVDMINNIFMPGVPDDGRAGNVVVSKASATQIEDVKQIAADYLEYVNSVYFVQNKQTFAGQVMGRFKQLRQQKQLMTVTPQSLVQVKEGLIKALADAQVLFEAPKVPTVGDYLNLVLSIDNFLQTLAQNPAQNRPVIFALSSLFQPEFNILNQLEQVLSGQGLSINKLLEMSQSSDPNEVQQAQQFLSLSVEPLYEGYKQVDPTVLLPSLGAIRGRYDQLIAQHTAVHQNYTQNAEELDSQIDLLQRVVQLLALE